MELQTVMERSVVVVGSCNTDLIIKSPRIPKPGETILGGDFVQAQGGKGANQAVAAARSGGDVCFISSVGDDAFGQKSLESLEKEGIDISHTQVINETPSGVALIFVSEASGENSIAVASGANAKLSPGHIRNAEMKIRPAKVMLLQLETPLDTVSAAAKFAYSQRVLVILNPAPAVPLDRELLQHVSILTPNETEAELLTGVRINGTADAVVAAKMLSACGIEHVIITMGSEGVLWYHPDGHKQIPSLTVSAVDTTAAGDTFNGALATALAEGKGFEDAIRFGCVAAAISVSRLGAQPSIPHRSEIDGLLERS